MDQFVFWAAMVGVIASISLLLGSAIGIYFRVSSTVIGLMAAFGAGALLSTYNWGCRRRVAFCFIGSTH